MMFLQAEQCWVVFLGEDRQVFLVPLKLECHIKVKYK
jgi:hypothetical protein